MQQREDALTPEEIAELRELLPVLRSFKSWLAGAGAAAAAKPLRKHRRPPPEAYEYVAKLRRKKGLDP
jgi:hypothetical protein